MPKTINSEAPVFTPSMLGSAIGFFVIDCIRSPDTLRLAPAINPNMVLGILALTTFTLYESRLVPKKASITSDRPTFLLP